MKDSESSNDVVVELTGVEAECEVSRIAGQSRTRTGKKKKGKHELEVIKGEEFNISGDLMNKERIIDRKNNYYKEIVSNIDTGEIVRNIEEPLKEHVGRGHAKHKENKP